MSKQILAVVLNNGETVTDLHGTLELTAEGIYYRPDMGEHSNKLFILMPWNTIKRVDGRGEW